MTEIDRPIERNKSIKGSNIFHLAQDIVSLSGLPEEEQENILREAYRRAFRVRNVQRKGEEAAPYEGPHAGLVEIATNSMVSTINLIENRPLPE